MLEATEEGDYSVAVPTLSKAFAIIDKNVKRGILHKNTAARKKSQLHLQVKHAARGGACHATPIAMPVPMRRSRHSSAQHTRARVRAFCSPHIALCDVACR